MRIQRFVLRLRLSLARSKLKAVRDVIKEDRYYIKARKHIVAANVETARGIQSQIAVLEGQLKLLAAGSQEELFHDTSRR